MTRLAVTTLSPCVKSVTASKGARILPVESCHGVSACVQCLVGPTSLEGSEVRTVSC